MMSTTPPAPPPPSSCKVKDTVKQKLYDLHDRLLKSKKKKTTTTETTPPPSTEDDDDDCVVVLIVGGGYGGVRAAKDLDKANNNNNKNKKFRVVLLDRKEFFLNNIAGVPAAVQPGYADSMCIPYDTMFSSSSSSSSTSNSVFLQAEVKEIKQDCVLVINNNNDDDKNDNNNNNNNNLIPLYFDYCIIATGSSYSFPFKIADSSYERALMKFEQVPKLIQQAKHIVIAGGGAVGCEMAGEIATHYNTTKTKSGNQKKRITLVHSREALLPGDIKDELRSKTLQSLQTLGVTVMLGERLMEGLDDTANDVAANQTFLTGIRQLTTNKRTTIKNVDLVFLCWGAAVNSASLQQQQQQEQNNKNEIAGCVIIDKGPNKGRVEVDPNTLCVGTTTNIFAIGDVAALESKMACYAGEQGSYVAKKILSMVYNNNNDTTDNNLVKEPDDGPYYWGHPYPAMMVPLGGTSGYMQTPCAKGNILGPPFAAMGKNHLIKSWALTVRPTVSSFQCPFSRNNNSNSNNKDDNNKNNDEINVRNNNNTDLAKALGVSTQEDALLAIERGRFPVPEVSDGQTNT